MSTRCKVCERQIVICDFKMKKKDPAQTGIAFLIDGDVQTILRASDGTVVNAPVWTFYLRYEHGCMPIPQEEAES